MKLVNTKEYNENGEYVCIKNSKGEILVRLYFSDYKSEDDCIASAKQLLLFLEVAQATTKNL